MYFFIYFFLPFTEDLLTLIFVVFLLLSLQPFYTQPQFITQDCLKQVYEMKCVSTLFKVTPRAGLILNVWKIAENLSY